MHFPESMSFLKVPLCSVFLSELPHWCFVIFPWSTGSVDLTLISLPITNDLFRLDDARMNSFILLSRGAPQQFKAWELLPALCKIGLNLHHGHYDWPLIGAMNLCFCSWQREREFCQRKQLSWSKGPTMTLCDCCFMVIYLGLESMDSLPFCLPGSIPLSSQYFRHVSMPAILLLLRIGQCCSPPQLRAEISYDLIFS